MKDEVDGRGARFLEGFSFLEAGLELSKKPEPDKTVPRHPAITAL
jgi:hypothetical protein